MSRYYKYRRFAALAACVGAASAAAALSSAAPAMATVKCAKSNVYGSGSSFGNAAQLSFISHWATFSECEGGPPTLKYNPTGSGPGLLEYGFGNVAKEKAEVFQPQENKEAEEAREKGVCKILTAATASPKEKCLDLYMGTDDAPTTEQLKFGTTASGGKSNSLAGEEGHRGDVVIPTTQGPLAAMLSLPSGCVIPEGEPVDLTNEVWANIFRGAKGGVTTWKILLEDLGYTKVANESELSSSPGDKLYFEPTTLPEEAITRVSSTMSENVIVHSQKEIEEGENLGGKLENVPNQVKVKVKGEGCGAKVKPTVRELGSGTTYATKAYFNQIEPGGEYAGIVNDERQWPEEGGVFFTYPETNGSGTLYGIGNGNKLAENTAANPGAFGYADSANAVNNAGETNVATVTQRPAPATSTLKEVVPHGEVEIKKGPMAGKKEVVLTLEAQPVKSIKHQNLYANVQNNGVKPKGEKGTGATFAEPLFLPSHEANCETNLIIKGDEAFPKHWNRSWFGTLVSDPNITATAGIPATDYPACAITYDVAQHHYRNVNLYGHEGGAGGKPTENAELMATTAKDYFNFMIGEGGKLLAKEGFYTGIPTAMKGYVRAAVKNIEP